jgi:hypothetical protein
MDCTVHCKKENAKRGQTNGNSDQLQKSVKEVEDK